MPAPGPMVVFVDANVWYSRTLRDWVGRLYTLPETPPFEVRWTEDVMAEVLYSLRRKHPAWDGGRITRIRDLLQPTFEVGRVESFPMDERYQGKDPRRARSTHCSRRLTDPHCRAAGGPVPSQDECHQP